jgi:hypothetical protein
LSKKIFDPLNLQVEVVGLEDCAAIAYTYDRSVRGEGCELRGVVRETLDESKRLDQLFTEGGKGHAADIPSFTKVREEGLIDTAQPAPTVPKTLHKVSSRDRLLLNSVHQRCVQKREELKRVKKQNRENGGDSPPSSSSSSSSGEAEQEVEVVRDVHSFERLNTLIVQRSAKSDLVMLNLPNIWGLQDQDCEAYMAYCDCLTNGLERVMFVHSAGHEVFSVM